MSQKGKEKAREYHLKRTYGISLDQYNALLKKQKHRCNVCKRHEKEFDKNLSVDHDHVTLEIRGLLCTYCNRYIVGRHRDASLLRTAAKHVEQKTGWFVPKKRRRKRKKD